MRSQSNAIIANDVVINMQDSFGNDTDTIIIEWVISLKVLMEFVGHLAIGS